MRKPLLLIGLLALPLIVAAHDVGERAPFNPNRACLVEDPVTLIVGLSSISNDIVAEFWRQMRLTGECRYFAHGLGFWPDEDAIVAQMQWGPAHRSQVMYVVRGHEAHGMTVYIWATAAQAEKLGIRSI